MTIKLAKNLIQKTTPIAIKENVIVHGNYRYTVLTDRLIRIEKGRFTDEATISIFNRKTGKVSFTSKISTHKVVIKTKELILTFDEEKPFEANFVVFKKDLEKKKRFLDNKENLKGTMRTLDTYFDGGFCVRRDITDFRIETLPLSDGILSKNGVSVIDDTISPILLDDGLPHERPDGTEYDKYVFASFNDYQSLINDFYQITGPVPLIPRWALGNWWSRYHPYTDKEYLSVLDRFEEEQVPLSVAVIDMDWHYVDIEKEFKLKELGRDNALRYGSTWGWTGVSWNKHLFPNYKETLKEIKRRGLKVTLNLHPKDGVRWFEDMYKDMSKAMGMNPDDLYPIEFDPIDPSYINNFFKYVIHPYEKAGVDFWWIDYQQERETKLKNLDPMWPLNHYHYLDSNTASKDEPEHLILSRYAELGSHRYPLGFSGDTKMIWEFLQFMPYFTFTASNAGYTWWSHDIGAHHYGIKDNDLYVRWIEYGVFSPVNRIHGNLMDVLSKEPWLHHSDVRFITDYYLRFRHRLIPYLYHYSHITHEDGIALIRPLYYKYPERIEAYQEKSTYYFGDTIVSPIVEKRGEDGYSKKTLWLPEGRWIDYFTRRIYEGNQYITIYRDLGETPFFIREGTILPLQNDIFEGKETNSSKPANELEINIAGFNAELTLRESQSGIRLNTVVKSKYDKSSNKIHIFIHQDSDEYYPREYHIKLLSLEDGDVRIKCGNKKPKWMEYERAWNLGFTWSDMGEKDINITISNVKILTFKEYLDRNALYILTGDNGVNEHKQSIYEHIRDHIFTKDELIQYVDSLNESEELKGRLKELSYF